MSVPSVATAIGAAPSYRRTVPAPTTTREARAFERVLLEQLTTQLASTAAPEDASPATSAYRDLLPGAMADALSAAGGLGLATAPGTPATTGREAS